jgi:lysyl-tRNA synthetase class 2
VNPTVRHTLQARHRILRTIRDYLDDQDFIEMETPILQSQPGGAEAKPFETFHHSLHLPLTLRIATELHLKRLICGGFDKVYEIGRIFRNEGLSTRHNPEFTSIELYQAYVDYEHMMKMTEEIVVQAAHALEEKGWLKTPSVATNQSESETKNETETESKGVAGKRLKILYQAQEIDLTPPWRRISMLEIIQETTGIDFYPYLLEKQFTKAYDIATKTLRIPSDVLSKATTVGEIVNVVFESKCEHLLQQPTFITNHPIEISPLAKPHRALPGLTERFELFIVGREHANAFSELTDPLDQRERFNRQVSLYLSLLVFVSLVSLYFYSYFSICRLKRKREEMKKPVEWMKSSCMHWK